MDPKHLPIDRVIIDAILPGTFRAGARPGEQSLATVFELSRTLIREALMRLETRGIPRVSPRRGWFVIEPSVDEAQEAFQARRAVVLGILRTATAGPELVEQMSAHIRQEREAVSTGDAGACGYLLGDLHVCMAEARGHWIPAGIPRDRTARTVLISVLYQSTHDAETSRDKHAAIIDAIATNHRHQAAALRNAHFANVEAGLTRRIGHDALPAANLGRETWK